MSCKHLMRSGSLMLIALATALQFGCGTWDGHFCLLGYTTRPPYDIGIRTVRVPIFKNVTMHRGIEFDITEAVIREIEAKTPFKVVQGCVDADTELIGTVVGVNKGVVNLNQLGETRAAETTLSVELVWRDLRPGRGGDVLSQPLPGRPGDPLPPPVIRAPAPPVLVQAISDDFIPELGSSITTARKQMVDRLAIKIVSMMEKPW